MAEMLAAVAILSMLMMMFSMGASYEEDPIHMFPYDYLLNQSIAMAKAQSTVFEGRNGVMPQITFNEKGNVSKAMTLPLGKNGKDVIIELGPGKIVFR